MQQPQIVLNNSVRMPQIGFGVFQIPAQDCVGVVKTALQAGYRLLDTAQTYCNEREVGRGIRESGLAREEVFVTTKVWVTEYGKEKTRRSLDASLERLGLDYVDMVLLHFPVPHVFERTIEAWQDLEKELANGRVRAIGVCNFHIPHLERLMDACTVVPAVNQVELHPYFSQESLMDFHARHGIATQAWSPLGAVMIYDAAGISEPVHVLQDETLCALAQRYGKSPAQIVLRWHLQRGVAIIPKSVHEERIRQNLDILDFALSDEDMALVNGLNRNMRGALDPDMVRVDTYETKMYEQ